MESQNYYLNIIVINYRKTTKKIKIVFDLRHNSFFVINLKHL